MKILKGLIIGMIALVLVTVGIDAADHYDNVSESLIGRVLGVEEKGPCPADMVFVPTAQGGFCMDIYEVSPGIDCPVKNVASQVDSRMNLSRTDCKPVSEQGRDPWRYISQTQAITACAKAGKRLPTNEEWYQASLGTPDIASGWSSSDCHVAKNWDSQPGLTGSGDKCVSSYGAFDMIGNAWEWVYGEIEDGKLNGKEMPDDGYIQSVNLEGVTMKTGNDIDENFNNDYFWIKKRGLRGMARGGYWDSESDAGIYAMYLVSPPSYSGAGIGFRCVK